MRRALGMESQIDPLAFMAINNNLILNFVWTTKHGFSHPKIDEELEAAERQVYSLLPCQIEWVLLGRVFFQGFLVTILMVLETCMYVIKVQPRSPHT